MPSPEEYSIWKATALHEPSVLTATCGFVESPEPSLPLFFAMPEGVTDAARTEQSVDSDEPVVTSNLVAASTERTPFAKAEKTRKWYVVLAARSLIRSSVTAAGGASGTW